RAPKGRSAVNWEEICAHAGGLIALWGGGQSALVHATDPNAIAGQLHEAFGDRLYGLLTRHRRAADGRHEARLRQRAERYGLPLVAAREVLYHTPARRPLQDVLTCLRHQVTLATA